MRDCSSFRRENSPEDQCCSGGSSGNDVVAAGMAKFGECIHLGNQGDFRTPVPILPRTQSPFRQGFS